MAHASGPAFGQWRRLVREQGQAFGRLDLRFILAALLPVFLVKSWLVKGLCLAAVAAALYDLLGRPVRRGLSPASRRAFGRGEVQAQTAGKPGKPGKRRDAGASASGASVLGVRLAGVLAVDMISEGKYRLRVRVCHGQDEDFTDISACHPQRKGPSSSSASEGVVFTSDSFEVGAPGKVALGSAGSAGSFPGGPPAADTCYYLSLELLFRPQTSSSGSAFTQFEEVATKRLAVSDGGYWRERCSVAFDADDRHFCVVELQLQVSAAAKEGAGKGGAGSGPDASDASPSMWPRSFPEGLLYKEEEPTIGIWRHRRLMSRIRSCWDACAGEGEDVASKELSGSLLAPRFQRRSAFVEELPSAAPARFDCPVLVERPRTTDGGLEQPVASPGEHLIVLVASHRAAPDDLRALRNFLALAAPEARFLVARVVLSAARPPPAMLPYISGDPKCDLSVSAVRLASEVSDFIQALPEGSASLGRLSFVAHGTGGLVVRAALPWMREYVPKLHAFITLCTPHLGLWPLGLPSFWHRMFFWVLRVRFPSPCMEQLALNDGRHACGSLVHRLSAEPVFELFKKVVLLHSHQDRSVPVGSAEFEVSLRWLGPASWFSRCDNGPSIVDLHAPVRSILFGVCKRRAWMWENVNFGMISRITGKVASSTRVDVDFGGLDGLLVGHTTLLKSRPFLRTLARAYCEEALS
mmetsp:Transcript_150027/g.482168  ORF Transcript_150027/g.482168 Transcript_150027/m.482168 type:complete len:695 (-) Transcript_150027:244-2328(-)